MAERTHLEVFHDNLADADLLVDLALALDNLRPKRARRELREKIGPVIRAKKSEYELIDCIESDDFFLVFKPGTDWGREHLQDRGPLLRQAVMAGAAAFEAYLGDRVVAEIRAIIRRKGEFTKHLASLPMSVGEWEKVEEYKYRRRGITEVVISRQVRQAASTAPNKVGHLLAMVGTKEPMKALDKHQKLNRGTTEAQLEAITDRRNQIAHEADRKGRGRAAIAVHHVHEMLDHLEQIATAIDEVIGGATR